MEKATNEAVRKGALKKAGELRELAIKINAYTETLDRVAVSETINSETANSVLEGFMDVTELMHDMSHAYLKELQFAVSMMEMNKFMRGVMGDDSDPS